MFSIIYCRDLGTRTTLYFIQVTSRNISKALLAVFSLYFCISLKMVQFNVTVYKIMMQEGVQSAAHVAS